MQPKPVYPLLALCVVICLLACNRPNHPFKIRTASPIAVAKPKQNTENDPVSKQAKVYTKGDSAYVIFNNQTLCISKKYNIDLKNIFPLICQVKDGVVKKSGWMIAGNLTFISILEDTDRGYTDLYVIDNNAKTLVKDKKFERDFLAGFGLFVFNDDKIFTMHKHYNDERSHFKSVGSLYAIKNDQFVYMKSRIEQEEISDDDMSIINFSKKSLNKKF